MKMYCMKCGSMMEPGANFCTVCGAKAFEGDSRDRACLDVYESDGPIEDYSSAGRDSGRSIKRFAAISMVVVLLIIAVAVMFAPPSADDVPERSYTIGDMTVFGDLYSDDVTISSEPTDASLIYTGEGTDVVWKVKVLSDTALTPVGSTFVKRGYDTSSGSTLRFTEPGNYEVILIVDGKGVHSGRAVLDGDVTTSYQWSQIVDRRVYSYSFQFTYEFSDYYRYATMENVVRRSSWSLDDSRFVVVDDTILSLEDALSKEYLRVHGPEASLTGHEYADYLLSFVQCVITYPTMVSPGPGSLHYYKDDENGIGDYYLNGVEEYWAFPMETLYLRMGDCEDTSFLSCALFSAAGYRSALITIPEHMLSAVAIDSSADNPSPFSYAPYYFVLKDGTRMYCCETTYESAVPAGYCSKRIVSDLREVDTLDLVEPFVPEGSY